MRSFLKQMRISVEHQIHISSGAICKVYIPNNQKQFDKYAANVNLNSETVNSSCK